MPALPTATPKQFIQGAPVLHVPDVMATVAFYRDVLGFTCDFGDAAYAVVWRDNVAIHFVKGEERASGLHLFLWVKDVEAYYREVVGRGARVDNEPEDQPYGLREFALHDVNGVKLVFGQDVEPA